jgi:hypothetical protein
VTQNKTLSRAQLTSVELGKENFEKELDDRYILSCPLLDYRSNKLSKYRLSCGDVENTVKSTTQKGILHINRVHVYVS